MKTITFDQLPYAIGAILEKLNVIESKIESAPEFETVPDYLDIDQLMAYLPSRPAKQTIYQLVSSKKIPCLRINRKLFFIKTEIDKWVEAKRKPTTEQLDQYAEEFFNKKIG